MSKRLALVGIFLVLIGTAVGALKPEWIAVTFFLWGVGDGFIAAHFISQLIERRRKGRD